MTSSSDLPKSEPEDFYAADLDGDSLALDLAGPDALKSYGALCAVTATTGGKIVGLYLDRVQVERLRDYCAEVLAFSTQEVRGG